MRATLWVVILAIALALVACKPERKAFGPQVSNVEGVAPDSSWTLWSGQAPLLVYFEAGQRKMSIACRDVSFEASADWFEAVQAWPQPDLAFKFGDEVVSDAPDASVRDQGVGLEIRTNVSDRLLMAIDRASEVVVSFNGEERRVALPEHQVDEFLGGCRKMTPPGMR